MKLQCLVVDDEPLARKGMAEYVHDVPFLHLAGECENAVKAGTVLREKKIDLILLDIKMPKLSGIDFLKSLKNPPLVIFTTAFSEFALEGFELDVMDYLVKPIGFDRFLKAAQKALDYYQLKQGAGGLPSQDFFFVKCNGKFEKILFNDVLFVEAMQNYIIIRTQLNKFIVYLTLTKMENELPADRFIKVHKSFVVSISQVNSVDGNDLCIGQHRIPVSRMLKDQVMKKILENKTYRR